VTTRTKAGVSARLPLRRGLDENEAAVYLSLSPTFLRELVAGKMMPRPRVAGGRRIWDVDELYLAFKALPREGGEDEAIFAERKDSWDDFR
jgi:hypothetical protein